MKERPTEGMPDMMPKGTVDNPPQKEPQNISDRMVDQPLAEDYGEDIENEDKDESPIGNRNENTGFDNDEDYVAGCL